MKQGPFVLITSSETLLNQEYPGVMTPGDFSANLLSSPLAVIFDMALPADQLKEMEQACHRQRTAFFSWSVPAGENIKEVIEVLLDFLREQNEWKNVDPSPGTVARLERETLVDIITTANSLLEPEEVMRTVMYHIHELISCEAWSVLILDNDEENSLHFAVAYGPGKDQLAQLKVPFGKGIAGWVAQHRQPIIVNNAQNDPRFLSKIDHDTQFVTRSILCAPLVSRGRTIGVIEMINGDSADGFTEQELELVQVLVNPAAVAIENAFLFQKAQTLAIQDDLTKLYNSRHLNHCLDVELKQAKHLGNLLSLIFLDLDGFKAVNDNHGHLVGSRALIDIGDIIRQVCREGDIAGRYGGDEFMLILPNTDLEQGLVVAEKIRDNIAGYRIMNMGMTASIGLACYPTHGEGRENLMRLADKAMYRVKQKGKNGILCAHEL